MKRSVVVLGMIGMIVAVAVGRFAAQEARQAPETDVNGRAAKLQEQTQLLEERIVRLKADADRLAAAFKRSEETVATLSKQVKTIAEAQERLGRAVSVDPSGAVRILGNLHLDNNVLEDIRVVDCDAEGISGNKRQCKCPTGLVTIGIELRALSTSAFPGPSTYNTALVCGRI
jgi:hypothetical protein